MWRYGSFVGQRDAGNFDLAISGWTTGENLDFVDESKRLTEPFIMSQTNPSLTSLDPIKGNDGSINILNTNLYIRLVNLTDDDEVTSEGSLSALRSGEIHLLYSVPEDKFKLVEDDEKLTLQKRPSNGVSYAFFNLLGESKFSDLNLRQAVLNTVDQDQFLAVYDNLKIKAYSTLTPLLDTGNVHKADLGKAKEYLQKYWDAQ